MPDCYTNIITAISRGDEQALAQLFHQFHGRLSSFANTIVHSPEISEEVVEDVFLKVWRNRQQLPQVGNLEVYLYVATKNTALNAICKKVNKVIVEPFDTLEFQFQHQHETPYDILLTHEMQSRMHQAIDKLPPRCKMIFKLVREDGLKYKDVATILNISVNTIDAQMAIAVKRISRALQLSRCSSLSAG